MLHKIRTAAISAMIGLGALAAIPATAQADSFYFGISPNGPRAGVIIDQGHTRDRHDDRWDRGRWDRRHWDRRSDRSCTPNEALRKADRMGLDRAYVRYTTWRSIVVAGRSHWRHVTVEFAKAPNCPVIG